ncbi:MAG: arginine decarboxylase [Campylobacteraceae bacterium 4484_4]|nr:MAG: arginine decarboxylase [Campylobacteraceae bacterium 4484_4]
MQQYGIDIWGDDNFIIHQDKVCINHKSRPSLYEIVQKIRSKGHRGPLLLRFPHLIEKQIREIYTHFARASRELSYHGKFRAVFPLKVNQYPNFIKALLEAGAPWHYGLEAGSKAELLIAMAYADIKAPMTVNGFKDKEMITMGFLAAKLGHNITLTIEGINELEAIIEVAKEEKGPLPNIGLRVRLHSLGIGLWAKSGGINSKFGLSSTELITALKLLKEHDLLEQFTMIHFHIGSQISDIGPLKKALREVGNLYAELIKIGATHLQTINLGGGLAVEYSQNSDVRQRNYSLREYANDIVFMLQMIAKDKRVKEPDIMIEAGRFIAANHAVLVAPVFELFSEEYHHTSLSLKEQNPPLIDELNELYQHINLTNALEYLHDAIDHLNSLLTLFDLGYIDLIDRSNAEVLVHLIIKKATYLLKEKNLKEILHIQEGIQEKYLINFSIFQSLPDFWGLGQNFPIMPLSKLDEKPTRSASLWDITCDSDGEIDFSLKNPLFLHSLDVDREDYFLGFFLVGAYQEILGMRHNLFTHPTEVTVTIDEEGYQVIRMIESQTIIDILDDLDYNPEDITARIKKLIETADLKESKEALFARIAFYMEQNGYLKTVHQERR